jgi:hypothetical protein
MTDRPATFRLCRDADVSGVSGTGHVADGVRWPDGSASVRWRGNDPSIVFWDDFGSVDRIHGHGGATRIVWDNEWLTPPDLRTIQGHVEDVLQGEVEGWDDQAMREALWTVLRDVQPLVAEVAALRKRLTEAEQRADCGTLDTLAAAAEDGRFAAATRAALDVLEWDWRPEPGVPSPEFCVAPVVGAIAAILLGQPATTPGEPT